MQLYSYKLEGERPVRAIVTDAPRECKGALSRDNMNMTFIIWYEITISCGVNKFTIAFTQTLHT